MAARNRILKELRSLDRETIPEVGIQLTDNIFVIHATITASENPLYKNKTFKLRITVGEDYPFNAPTCVFTKLDSATIPTHPHIYSNGHICLDLLGPAWTPIHTIRSILVSLQSFLASNTRLEKPPDDVSYCQHAPANPKRTTFVYHDDSV